MKKAVIYVFSGTGNTKLIADLYKKYLALYDFEITIYSIRMKTTENRKHEYEQFPNPADFDLIALAYPVHGFNAPKVMNDFCKILPALPQKKPTFIFKSSGEGLTLNNYSSQKIIPHLRRKNYDIICERHYVMPYNMIFRHSDEMVKSEFIYADALVRLNCKQISQINEGFREKVTYFPLRYWFVPIVRILWIYAKVQGPAMKVDMEKCIQCQKCVKSCPLGNIKFDGEKFHFGTNCVLCVCCSFGCPVKAISIGLLDGWRVNGSYNIEKTATRTDLEFPHFGDNLKGIMRILYYKYYRRVDKALSEGNVELKLY